MALANTRAVQQLNIHSPSFKEVHSKIKLSPSQVSENKVSKMKFKQEDEDESDNESSGSNSNLSTPSLPSATTSSSSSISSGLNGNGTAVAGEKPKKKYNVNPDKHKHKTKINVAATGISTKIPVTGERPRPTKHNSLEDEVLFTIFQILYDYDLPGKGMTVKQICDVLLEKHEEMAKLSTKTSNLVSAKLNAYVKRVEKGEKNLKYALSREWADTSPKRMVYVYRGILTTDYHIHAQSAMKSLEETFSEVKTGANSGLSGNGAGSSTSLSSSALDKSVVNPVRLGPGNNGTHFDLRLKPLSIPYNADVLSYDDESDFDELNSAATGHQVTGSMTASSLPVMSSLMRRKSVLRASRCRSENGEESDMSYEFDALETFESESDDEIGAAKPGSRRRSVKRHKRLSKKTLTAAAAAPRIPKTVHHGQQPSVVLAAAASLRAAALHAMAPVDRAGTQNVLESSASPDSVSSGSSTPSKWLLMTQDVGMPEDISLDELDSMFG